MADLIDDSPKNENSNENNKINIENNDHPLPMMAAQLNPFFSTQSITNYRRIYHTTNLEVKIILGYFFLLT